MQAMLNAGVRAAFWSLLAGFAQGQLLEH